MSTDRELLQLAAKAAGLRGVATDLIPMGRLAFRVLPGDGSFHYWDPLTDDGDALRLAAKLGMVVVGDPYGDTGVTVQAGELRDTGVYAPSSEPQQPSGSPCREKRQRRPRPPAHRVARPLPS
jgi:hypothetical protein